MKRMRGCVGLLVATLAAVGCAPGSSVGESREALRLTTTVTWRLPWGDGPAAVGLRPEGPDFLAEGPSAVAVGPDGAAWVLDRLNRRVLRLEPEKGRVEVAAAVPEDAEDLTVGADGTLAVYSPLSARVLVGVVGAPREVAVPRSLSEIRGVLLASGRRVLVQTAHQERYFVGTPAAPQTLATMLHSRRAGEFEIEDGRGVAVRRLQGGVAELLLRRPGERLAAAAGFVLPERVLAARVVGTAGLTACLRLEIEQPGPGVSVRRTVVCHDMTTGARRFARDLAAPGRYLPRREIAVGGVPARLALLHAGVEGLEVALVPLGAPAKGAAP